MTPDELLAALPTDGLTREARDALRDPAFRGLVYARIPDHPGPPLRPLLEALLREEMAFRTALWRGAVDDPDDRYEQIYLAALLLGRVGDPADALLIWEAKHLNMDVGASMDSSFFVGAGLEATLAWLAERPEPAAEALLAYLDGEDEPELQEMAEHQLAWLRGDSG